MAVMTRMHHWNFLLIYISGRNFWVVLSPLPKVLDHKCQEYEGLMVGLIPNIALTAPLSKRMQVVGG